LRNHKANSAGEASFQKLLIPLEAEMNIAGAEIKWDGIKPGLEA